MRFPVCKPKLPTADQLMPYLQQVDNNRYYSNFGPLVQKLEQRLADRIGIDTGHIMTTASGTVSLVLSLMRLKKHSSPHVLMPAWTFIATAQAVLQCGFQPFFTDVHPETWALTPDIAREAMQQCPDDIAAIIPVAPYGLPLPIREWEAFQKETGIAVIIDGAAMNIDHIQASETVTIITSMHATKLLPAGEGGLIFHKDADDIEHLKHMSNFGIDPDGVASVATNAKMSEYHAAVAHASLDEWDEIKQDFRRVIARYHQNLKSQDQISIHPSASQGRISSALAIHASQPVQESGLHAQGVQARLSWRKGCHNEPLFSGAPRTDLSNTNHIIPRATGLPCSRDLPDADIDQICDILMQYLKESDDEQ